MSAYDAHQSLIEPARPSAGLPRLFAGVTILAIAVLAFNIAMVQVLQSAGAWDKLQFELITGHTARAMMITLYSFVFPIAALWVVLRLVHNRSFTSLIGPAGLAVHSFFCVFRLVLVLSAIFLVLPSPAGQQPEMHLGFAAWLPLVIPALLGILIQVSSEELIFRGYLQSQLAARFENPLVWMLIPSVLFGFLHLNAGVYGENAGLVAFWAFGFGIVAADLTARSGSLGPAIALHFVNNVVAIMILAMQHHWDGLALLHVPFGPQDADIVRAMLILEAPVLLCFWLVARIAIKR